MTNPENKKYKNGYSINFYPHYEYGESAPLIFVSLPVELTCSQQVQLLRKLDEFYADTEAETLDWALEYQLWARMMFCNMLPINTWMFHLDIRDDDIMSEICSIIGPENGAFFKLCTCGKRGNQLLKAAYLSYQEDEDCCESVFIDESRMLTA